MARGNQHLKVPRPGANAARRRYLASDYRPRFELALGHDPWGEGVSETLNNSAPLSQEEIASLGLADVPLSVVKLVW
jgi:hypothetical protein